MKKFMLFLMLSSIALAPVVAIPIAQASPKPKVTLCHWANGHPHAISVSVNAVENNADTGHGLLVVVDDDISLDSHDTPGHEQDSFLHVGAELKSNDVDDDELTDDELCADLVDNTGPEGPPGPPGESGHSPELTILCFPGAGLGVLVDYDGESQLPDGSFILGEGAICPLAGSDGLDGVDGKDGLNGTNGVDGNVGPAGPQGLTGPAGESVTTTTTTAPPVTTPVSDTLPHTGLSNWLWLAGAVLLLSGVIMSLLTGKRSNA